jgi:hypothetical protein
MPAPKSSAKPVLERVKKICLALPEAVCEIQGRHAAFLICKKTFAWFLDDHHGDGIVAISCKALPGDNVELVRAAPERFYLPAYMAHRGWVALRLDRGEPDWEEVAELIHGSYRMTAPKRLLAM